MGGKSGGPLSSWIKEFTTLVFVQTVHAYIYAIIITLIVATMNPNTAPSGDDYNTAVGLMCIVALTSLFKVEELVRKIFGLSNTKADHKGAIKSIAKTAFALKLGKRVLDNGKKLTSGVKQLKDYRSDKKTAERRFKEDQEDLGLGSPGGGTGGRSSGGTGGRSSGGTGGSSSGGTGGRSSGGTGGSSSGASTGAALDLKTRQKLRAVQRAQEDKVKQLKKSRNEGIKNIVSSLVESGGAVVGATAGGVLGGADGNLEEALQGLVSGAGLGDAAGQFTVNAVASTGGFMTNRVKGIADIEKDILKKGIKQTYRERKSPNIKALEKSYKDLKNYVDNAEKAAHSHDDTVDDT